MNQYYIFSRFSNFSPEWRLTLQIKALIEISKDISANDRQQVFFSSCSLPIDTNKKYRIFDIIHIGKNNVICMRKKLNNEIRRFVDNINFDMIIPNVYKEISFTWLLEMLSRKQIKRMWLMADGRFAIV